MCRMVLDKLYSDIVNQKRMQCLDGWEEKEVIIHGDRGRFDFGWWAHGAIYTDLVT